MPKLPISARKPNSRSLDLISPATYLLKVSDRIYFQTANARVPTIRVAAAIAKTIRFNRRRRRIGHISADEVDFMIRTNKANRKNNRGRLLFTKWTPYSSLSLKKFCGTGHVAMRRFERMKIRYVVTILVVTAP